MHERPQGAPSHARSFSDEPVRSVRGRARQGLQPAGAERGRDAVMPRTGLTVLLALLAAWPATGHGLELDFPGRPDLSAEVIRNPDSYMLPVGPWSGGEMPTLEVTGRVVQQAWRLRAPGLTTLQILRPLRKQLVESGFELLLDCDGRNCGGFDFRFGTRVLPAPDMFVDLFDYRFVSARKGSGGTAQYLSVLVSRSAGTGYVQVIHVTPETSEAGQIRASGKPRSADTGATAGTGADGAAESLSRTLETSGYAILGDLEFETGSAQLGSGPFGSLATLAGFLRDRPSRRIALVGHTDSVGSLESNIALSRRRAEAVARRLIDAHGVAAEKLEARGVGYLAPVASNLTEPGRDANRRVEAVVLATE